MMMLAKRWNRAQVVTLTVALAVYLVLACICLGMLRNSAARAKLGRVEMYNSTSSGAGAAKFLSDVSQHPLMYHPTKCFSCERQFHADDAWKGQDTKCFSCERDMATREDKTGFDAHALRFR